MIISKLILKIFSQTLYDIHAIGTAKFHSGFIAKIDASGILSTSYTSQVVDTYVKQSYSSSKMSSFCILYFSFRVMPFVKLFSMEYKLHMMLITITITSKLVVPY